MANLPTKRYSKYTNSSMARDKNKSRRRAGKPAVIAMPPSSPAANPNHSPNSALLSPVTPECTNRFHVLCHDQVVRLHEVMSDVIPIHGRGNFPTLEVKLTDIIQAVRNKLRSDGITIRDIRMNGGGASYIIGTDNVQPYNDVDLIFGVDLSNLNDLQKIKEATLDCLLNFLPDGVSKEKMTSSNINQAYINKLVKVCTEHDKWSLISFCNRSGKNVELKFVDSMKRQFEFTVDSFQIILDSLLTFYEVSEKPMSEHFYPTVIAESVYGNFEEALYHLNNKLIATRQPEEIRGGGLLKYCNLLVRGYQAANDVDLYTLQRYMCSRFFIDFSDIGQQKQKLENYLANHFREEEQHMMYDFLVILHNVVDESTICLMGHERRQTLSLIQYMSYQVLAEQEERARNKQYGVHQFDVHNNLVIDQVFYGPYNNHLTYYTNGYCYVYPPQPEQMTSYRAGLYVTASEEEDTCSSDYQA